jgi:hypothetical protein
MTMVKRGGFTASLRRHQQEANQSSEIPCHLVRCEIVTGSPDRLDLRTCQHPRALLLRRSPDGADEIDFDQIFFRRPAHQRPEAVQQPVGRHRGAGLDQGVPDGAQIGFGELGGR